MREDLPADLQTDIESVVEGWYMDRPFDWDDLFDRLESYGHTLPDQWDDPIARAVQHHARKVKREAAA